MIPRLITRLDWKVDRTAIDIASRLKNEIKGVERGEMIMMDLTKVFQENQALRKVFYEEITKNIQERYPDLDSVHIDLECVITTKWEQVEKVE